MSKATVQNTIVHQREEDAQQRRRVVTLLRVFLIVLVSVVVALAIVTESAESPSGVSLQKHWWVLVGGVLIFSLLVIAVDVVTPKRKLATISAMLFGCIAGLILSLLLGIIIDYLAQTFLPSDMLADEGAKRLLLAIKVIMGGGLCYLGAATVLQTQDDFRLVIPYVEFSKQLRGARPFLVDTSALIDGRILDIAETGLIQVPLIVPRFVIEELQTLSDSGDRLKRNRGRRGLDIVGKLQKNPRLDVTIDEQLVPGAGVDQMLVELAKVMPGTVLTTDSALSRIASIHGVASLNIHDLANALKPNVIPGEPLNVMLIKPGEQAGQGVGYLEDGTMVVAENGAGMIGRETQLVVTSTMQTSAGRLIFGRIREEEEDDSDASHAPAADSNNRRSKHRTT